MHDMAPQGILRPTHARMDSSTLSHTQQAKPMFYQGGDHERVRRYASTFDRIARGNPVRADRSEGLNRGWGDRDLRGFMLWQL